jgi:hypothetical protein
MKLIIEMTVDFHRDRRFGGEVEPGVEIFHEISIG